LKIQIDDDHIATWVIPHCFMQRYLIEDAIFFRFSVSSSLRQETRYY